MIITLKGADFSSSNIGTLSTWTIFTTLGSGATYSGNKTVDRGTAFSGTVTIADGYELGAAGVTVTMGGTDITSSAVTIDGNTITISISAVTGTVYITVPTVSTSTGEETIYYTITHKYVDAEGNEIQSSTTESVASGTRKDFTPPTIDGYTLSSVSPASTTVNSDITVTYTYTVEEGGDATNENVVFDFDFTTNTIDDYALDGLFTIPDGTDTSGIEYDSTYGANLNNDLPNGLNLVTAIDASRAWELEFTALFVTPTVLAGNRRAILAGANLTPFVFINGTTYDSMGFQISNGSHRTLYGCMVYDAETTYKVVHDGNSTVTVFVNGTEKGSVAVDFTDAEFTVMLGNVKGKSSAYIWQDVETDKKSYLKKIKFTYTE